MKAWSSLLLLAASPVWADAPDLRWDWMVSAAASQSNTEAVLFPEAENTRQADAYLELEAGYQNWLALVTLKSDALYHSGDTEADTRLIVRELFWQGSADVAGTSVDITAGKQRIDWGVGYGYRPLDLLKAYRRNPVGIQVEEGVGVLALSSFDGDGEWTLLAADSSWNSQPLSGLDKENVSRGAGLRRYQLAGDSEYQFIGYWDDVRQCVVGGSIVTVFDPAWEFHSSAAWQHSYNGYQISDDPYQPPVLATRHNLWQVMAGVTWAGESGHQLIAEYWYDQRAWSRDDWELAWQRAEMLSRQALSSLAHSYANGMQHANLVRHNVLLHWRFDSASWGSYEWSQAWMQDLTPQLDLMLSPGDGGAMITPRLNYVWHDSGQSRFETELAGRFVTGDASSVYQNLPDNYMIFLNLKGRF